jgi:hypothetical protein
LSTLPLTVACGDDGAPADAGRDGSTDAAPQDSGAPADAEVDAPDDAGTGGGACPSGECALLTGEGCGAGDACYFARVGDAGLAPVCGAAGAGGDGDPCEQLNDCGEGFMCDRQSGLCRHYCCMGSNADCPTGQTCAVMLTATDGSPTGVGFCKFPDSCDLLAQDCSGTQGCYPQGGDGSVICIEPRNTLTEGAACGFTNDCVPGLACIGLPDGAGGTENRCAAYCDATSSTNECLEGQECQEASLLPDGVGFCDPPMIGGADAGA